MEAVGKVETVEARRCNRGVSEMTEVIKVDEVGKIGDGRRSCAG